MLQTYACIQYTIHNIQINSEMGPVRQNPMQRIVRSVHMCVHCTFHNIYLLHTILHRTDLIISLLPSRQSALLR